MVLFAMTEDERRKVVVMGARRVFRQEKKARANLNRFVTKVYTTVQVAVMK